MALDYSVDDFIMIYSDKVKFKIRQLSIGLMTIHYRLEILITEGRGRQMRVGDGGNKREVPQSTLNMNEMKGFQLLGHSNWIICSLLS